MSLWQLIYIQMKYVYYKQLYKGIIYVWKQNKKTNKGIIIIERKKKE